MSDDFKKFSDLFESAEPIAPKHICPACNSEGPFDTDAGQWNTTHTCRKCRHQWQGGMAPGKTEIPFSRTEQAETPFVDEEALEFIFGTSQFAGSPFRVVSPEEEE